VRLKPFICYAREDEDVAERLADYLRDCGATPWLDRHQLKGGDAWKAKIRRAMRDASHILLLISRHSVTKRGFVQNEVRWALELRDELPPDREYIIPIRLDDTEPKHQGLKELHWEEVGRDERAGFAAVIEALDPRRHKSRRDKVQLALLRQLQTMADVAVALEIGDGRYIASHLALPERGHIKLLRSRREIYREAERLIQTSDLSAETRATTPLFDRMRGDDQVFTDYFESLARRCATARRKRIKLEHHAILGFSRSASGRVPVFIREAVELRWRIFSERAVVDCLKMYEVPFEWQLNFLLLGDTHAIIAFHEDAEDRRLQNGILLSDRSIVASLVRWFDLVVVKHATRVRPRARQLSRTA
jgi:TIR domain